MFLFFLIAQVLEAQLIQLTNSQLVNQIQTRQNITYYFQPYTQDSKNYIFIELRIQNYKDGQAQLLLTCSFNSITTYSLNGSQVQINSNYSDWNAYTNNKTYHNLLIPPYNSNYLWNDTYYLTIFIPSQTTYNYSLTITRSSTPPCPNNCNNYDDACKSGFCDCQQSFLDLDCSKIGVPLIFNNKMDNILVSGYKYFYYEVTNSQSSLTFTIQLSDASPQIFYSVVAYIMIEDFVYGVPNSQYYIQKDSITQQRQKITFIVDTKQITYLTSFLRYQRVLITIYSPQSAILLFQVQQTSSDGSFDTNLLLIYFLVSLAVVLLLTWIIITLIRYKQAQNSRVHDVAVVNRRRQPQNQQLNMQLIEKYMPKYQYFLIFETIQFKKKHVTKSTNDSCSVCLLEFDDYTECRFCPCLHIFHSECLAQWLLKHENCPNCRLELNEKELIKHEMELKYQQDQDQRSTQLNSIDKLQSTKKVRLQRPSNFLGQQDSELL